VPLEMLPAYFYGKPSLLPPFINTATHLLSFQTCHKLYRE
jgi:hypothetical protein